MVNPKLNTTNMCITNYNYENIHILPILNIECIELTKLGVPRTTIAIAPRRASRRVAARNSTTLHARRATAKLCQFPVSVSLKSSRN